MTGVTKAVVCALLSVWDCAYKRTLAANQKEKPTWWWQQVSSLAFCVVLYHYLMSHNSK